jgi:ribosomal protein S18 acetylase RimI-like enzyme
MNCSELDFRIKTASCVAIISHLQKCADTFIPPLYTYVKIDDYGKKIYDNAVTFEAWDKDILVGLVAAYYNNLETRIGYITNVSVLESHLGYGIASILLKQSLDYGKSKKFIEVRLEVNTGNLEAIKLYEKGGFINVDHRENTMSMTYFFNY